MLPSACLTADRREPSLQERELAAGSRLLPSQVLNMTAGLLREARRRGYVSKAEVGPPARGRELVSHKATCKQRVVMCPPKAGCDRR